MGDEHTRGLPAGRTEKRLVRMAGDAVREDYPNPERIGCPGSDAVEAVVARRLAFPDFDDVVDHIATCAPCLEEYNRRRLRRKLRNVGVVVVGCAGLLVLGLFWKYGPANQPRPREAVAKQAPAAVLTATLDYRNWTAERSGQSQPRLAETPHLARTQLDLTIDLPIGTEDAVYTVQFRSDSDKTVAEAVGNATWDGTAEVLKIKTDLRNVLAGAYTVAIRSADSSWHLYPVILE
jgi:hypothetical protein